MRSAPLPILVIALAASGCTKVDDQGQAADAVPTDVEAQAVVAAEAADRNAELPSEFLRTAWLATAADGARFTTLLDPEGRYRDLRNGDPFQEGSWEIDSEDRLCFLPDAEGAVLRCWQPDRMEGRNAMIASDQSGNRIRAERADYSPPASDEDR